MTSSSVVLREGDTHALRKERGAFFTPEPVARHLADSCMTTETRRVLEPSCGEAVFLLAAHDLAQEMGTTPSLGGIEIHGPSAAHARSLLLESGSTATITEANFFAVPGTHDYDVVLGNPPFVRFHNHAGDDRSLALDAARRAGVRLNELASSWAPFVAHATSFLARGGSLGLVLPAELLHADYAGPVRAMLMGKFRNISLAVFTQRVFESVQEEVVLLSATGFGEGSTSVLHVSHLEDITALGSTPTETTMTLSPGHSGERWTAALSVNADADPTGALIAAGAFAPMSGWGRVRLGAVTGANKYFTITAAEKKELQLADDEVVRISPPGSRHLRELSFDSADWESMLIAGASGYLFRPGTDPSAGARGKIRAGEHDEVDRAYKCRVRSPWWRTPLLQAPDLFLTYMNARTPQLAANHADVHHLNSIHGAYIHEKHRDLAMDLLPLAALNSASAVNAEFTGRGYGGGLLKLEPGEASRWAVPSPDLVAGVSGELHAIRPRVLECLRAGNPDAATDLVDSVVLGAAGMHAPVQRQLTAERFSLAARRAARAKRKRIA